MSALEETICVTGATGFIGSWLVKRLLELDYTVRATVQDLDNLKEVEHLLEMPNAKTNLTLWKADLNDEGSFDEAISGSTGVFHVATPKDYETKDPENDVIKPTINGLLDIMRSCIKAKVRRLVFTSSVGAVHIEEIRKSVYDETCWSDLEFCRSVKVNGWYYIVSKTLAEQAGWKFAEENNLDFIYHCHSTTCGYVGPFITPTMPLSFYAALSPIMRNEAHYSFIKQDQFVHLDDICMAHIFLYENSDAKGRYIASACDATIYDIGNLLREGYPEYNIPTKFKDFKEDIECVHLSSEKLKGLGFEFKHDLKDFARQRDFFLLLSKIKPYELRTSTPNCTPRFP